MGIGFIKKLSSSPRWNVWLGEMDGQKVVVKAPAFTITQKEIEYYAKRATIWWKLKKNPNVAELVAYDKKNATFMIKHYPKTLRQILEKRGKLPISLAVGIVLGIANALKDAHEKGVVHADIKPENIFLDEANTPKLGDWEDAIILIEDDNVVQYTPGYCAPEQKLNDPSRIDERTDIYQLGILLYEMIEGERPVILAYKRTPEYLRKIISKCLRDNPDERYQTINEIVREISVDIPKIKYETLKIETASIQELEEAPAERLSLEQALRKWGVASTKLLSRETDLELSDVLSFLEVANYAIKSRRKDYWYHRSYWEKAQKLMGQKVRAIWVNIDDCVKESGLLQEDVIEILRKNGYQIIEKIAWNPNKLKEIIQKQKILQEKDIRIPLSTEIIREVLSEVAIRSKSIGLWIEREFFQKVIEYIETQLKSTGVIDVDAVTLRTNIPVEDLVEALISKGYAFMVNERKIVTEKVLEKVILRILNQNQIISIAQLLKDIKVEKKIVEQILKQNAIQSRREGYYYNKVYVQNILQKVVQKYGGDKLPTKREISTVGILEEDIDILDAQILAGMTGKNIEAYAIKARGEKYLIIRYKNRTIMKKLPYQDILKLAIYANKIAMAIHLSDKNYGIAIYDINGVKVSEITGFEEFPYRFKMISRNNYVVLHVRKGGVEGVIAIDDKGKVFLSDIQYNDIICISIYKDIISYSAKKDDKCYGIAYIKSLNNLYRIYHPRKQGDCYDPCVAGHIWGFHWKEKVKNYRHLRIIDLTKNNVIFSVDQGVFSRNITFEFNVEKPKVLSLLHVSVEKRNWGRREYEIYVFNPFGKMIFYRKIKGPWELYPYSGLCHKYLYIVYREPKTETYVTEVWDVIQNRLVLNLNGEYNILSGNDSIIILKHRGNLKVWDINGKKLFDKYYKEISDRGVIWGVKIIIPVYKESYRESLYVICTPTTCFEAKPRIVYILGTPTLFCL